MLLSNTKKLESVDIEGCIMYFKTLLKSKDREVTEKNIQRLQALTQINPMGWKLEEKRKQVREEDEENRQKRATDG